MPCCSGCRRWSDGRTAALALCNGWIAGGQCAASKFKRLAQVRLGLVVTSKPSKSLADGFAHIRFNERLALKFSGVKLLHGGGDGLQHGHFVAKHLLGV